MRPTATAAVETVGVGRGLSVAEVAAVPAPSYTTGHSTLLNSLADHHTVLLELLGQDGVEEGVAARVEGEDEDGEDLGRLQRDEVQAEAGRQGQKGDGGPADEVGEHQQGHSLGNSAENKKEIVPEYVHITHAF